jgi:hypothetical protein
MQAVALVAQVVGVAAEMAEIIKPLLLVFLIQAVAAEQLLVEAWD